MLGFVKIEADLPNKIFPVTFQLLMMTMPLNLFVYGINDIFDYETDRENKRKGGIQGGVLPKKFHKIVYGYAFIASALFLFSSVVTLDLANIAVSAGLLLVAYFYSSPPLRLKEIPVVDSLSNALMFLLTYMIGWSYGGRLIELPLKVYLVSLGVAGIHALTAIVDYVPDKKAGVKTIATILGRRWTALFSTLCFLVTLVFADVSTFVVKVFIAYLALCGAVILVWPRDKMVELLSKSIFIAFFITAAIYIYVHLC